MGLSLLRKCSAASLLVGIPCFLVLVGFYALSQMAANNGDALYLQQRQSALKENQSFTDDTKKFPELLFYTRSDKCGGRSLIKVMEVLSKRNKFYLNLHGTIARRPPLQELVQFGKLIEDLPRPAVYQQHIHYFDFSKFGYRQPVFFNMIRDPIEQFVSSYNFKIYGDNTGKHDRPLSQNATDINDCISKRMIGCRTENRFHIGSFFCGQFPASCAFGSPQSVELAKRHIDDHYIFVGIVEQFEATLRILEKIMPDYFLGAPEVWKEIEKEALKLTATKTKQVLDPKARDMLKRSMAYEYAIYDHVKREFEKVKKELQIE